MNINYRRSLWIVLLIVLALCLTALPAQAGEPDGNRLGRAAAGSQPATSAPGRAPGAEAQAGDGWRPLPIDAGEMTSIAVDPGNAQTVYVGTRDGGVFKSTDGGATWSPASNGLTFFPIRSLTFVPQQPQALYAGTDNDGVWKSTDGGASWTEVSDGLDKGLIIFGIVADPQDPYRLYAAAAGGVGLDIGHVYRTTNGGASWQVVDAGLPDHGGDYTNGIYCVAVDPTNSAILYAGTNYLGAFRSTNGGQSWTSLLAGVPLLRAPDFYGSVQAFAFDPFHGNRVTAIINGKCFALSAGDEWQQVSQGVFDATSGIFPAQLAFHPTQANVLYAAGDRFTRSTDGGANWTQTLGWTASGGVNGFAFHRSTPNTLYGATGPLFQHIGGVFKSTDGGVHWAISSRGVTAGEMQSVAVDPANPSLIYAGDGGSHLFRSTNGGATWSNVDLGGFGVSDIAVDSQGRVFATAASFFRSTDHGQTFTEDTTLDWPECMVIAPGTPETIWVGQKFGHGIWKSTNGGTSWTEKNTGLPSFGGSLCPVISLAVDPHNSATLWAGTQYGGGILRSIDGGEHWVTRGLTKENTIDAIAVSPLNSNVILVGGSFSDGRIYKSVDGGATWQVKADEIAAVMDITYDPRNPQWVYAATEGYGVLRSTNGGETWHLYGDGIFYPLVYDLAIRPGAQPQILAASYGSGLYALDLGGLRKVYMPLGKK